MCINNILISTRKYISGVAVLYEKSENYGLFV